jgi:hypothetical protein
MAIEEQVTNAKAILGAVFIQYFLYSIVYIVDGAKYKTFYEKENESPKPQA